MCVFFLRKRFHALRLFAIATDLFDEGESSVWLDDFPHAFLTASIEAILQSPSGGDMEMLYLHGCSWGIYSWSLGLLTEVFGEQRSCTITSSSPLLTRVSGAMLWR